jgi:hypothetical protein
VPFLTPNHPVQPAVARDRALRRRRARAGLSMVESAVGLAAAGIVLAGFVPTFIEHVRLSKIAEATELLDELHRGAAAYYARDQRIDGKLARGCLPHGVGPFPEQPSPDPMPVDFATDEAGRDTWAALGAQAGSLRYRYQVLVDKPGCKPHEPPRGAAVIVFRAEGDLDGDGVLSLVERAATLSADQSELVAVPPLKIERRVE